jgi:hypothetical protein
MDCDNNNDNPPPSSFLSSLSPDLLLFLLHFLTPRSTLRLALTHHPLYNLIHQNDHTLFKPHVLRQQLISSPQAPPLSPSPSSPTSASEAAALELKAALGLRSWKEIYVVARFLVGVPCLGFFRRMPRDFATDFKGRLLRLRPLQKSLEETHTQHNDGGSSSMIEETEQRKSPSPRPPGLCLEHVNPDGSLLPLVHIFVKRTYTHTHTHTHTRLDVGGGHLTLELQEQGEGGMVMEWRAGRGGRPGTLKEDADKTSAERAEEQQILSTINKLSQGCAPAFQLAFSMEDYGGEFVLFDREYYPLPREVPKAPLPPDMVLQQLCGLWVGTYGSHGKEILHVRFVDEEVEVEEEEGHEEQEGDEEGEEETEEQLGFTLTTPLSFHNPTHTNTPSNNTRTHTHTHTHTPPPLYLEGLKIVGDANVPANQFSFRVPLTPPLDPYSALAADPRPVYSLDDRMVPTQRFLLHEAHRVHALYRGKGGCVCVCVGVGGYLLVNCYLYFIQIIFTYTYIHTPTHTHTHTQGKLTWCPASGGHNR